MALKLVPDRSRLQAISLDLDDTLWPVAPVLERAELALLDWFRTQILRAAQPAHADLPGIDWLRSVRDAVMREHPGHHHDFSRLRRLAIEQGLREWGLDPADTEQAYAVFCAERNCVQLYADVPEALERLSRNYRLVSISNGTAELQRVGLRSWFQAEIRARELGVAKPDPRTFQAACIAVSCRPEQVLHVGDHPHQDVQGARAAGLPSVWLDRHGGPWPPTAGPVPRTFADLGALADWLGV